MESEKKDEWGKKRSEDRGKVKEWLQTLVRERKGKIRL